jgi:hypothetical protein
MPVEDPTPDQPTPGDTRTDHTSADEPAPADRDQEASP